MTSNLLRTLTLATVAAAALAVAGTALAGSGGTALTVIGKPDSKVVKTDPDTGDPVKHDPYVQFTLLGAKHGAAYRLRVLTAPPRKPTALCNGGLDTQPYRAMGGGRVLFPLEPVGSGKYFPFAGQEPCHGTYTMTVEERQPGTWMTVRRFSFGYPSFKIAYLALHP